MYPYGELHSLGNVIPRQMRTAGINTPANKRTGMHAFRHGLATRMLEMMFLSLLYHKHLDMQISQAQKFT